MEILLGVTGSVAAKLTSRLVDRLIKDGHQVQVIGTKASFYFWKEEIVSAPVYREEDEWPGDEYSEDNPILHIALRDWAKLLLIAPLTANTLAKIANGLSDNLLTSVVRAWDPKRPIVIAPAMNTKMWEHPITQMHLEQAGKFYRLNMVSPIAKKLACGETGIGAMARIEDIAAAINSFI
jgi:phosphopantothenoylcysteine decarboxylase